MVIKLYEKQLKYRNLEIISFSLALEFWKHALLHKTAVTETVDIYFSILVFGRPFCSSFQ